MLYYLMFSFYLLLRWEDRVVLDASIYLDPASNEGMCMFGVTLNLYSMQLKTKEIVILYMYSYFRSAGVM